MVRLLCVFRLVQWSWSSGDDKYEIIIYWINEDGAFVAEAPELPGCAAHGDTQQAALEQIGQAMDLWLETAREFGDPIPEPKGERLMLA